MLLSRDKKWKKKGAIDPEVIITNAVPVRAARRAHCRPRGLSAPPRPPTAAGV